MKLIKSFFQNVSSRFLAVVTLLWLSVENAFATGGGNGINASKIPDFKIPGVDSNTKDPMEIIYLVAKSLATLCAILFAAWSIMTVVKALIKTYNAATDENDKKDGAHLLSLLFLVSF